MNKLRHSDRKQLWLVLAIMVVATLWLARVFQPASSAAGSPHSVHIALGFHVNLYHSLRGDTNDENGFGQDIRVIRHTIRELDRYNHSGIPVSAVWDFDNLFSLEELLSTSILSLSEVDAGAAPWISLCRKPWPVVAGISSPISTGAEYPPFW